jgi:hypothetical protein
MPCGKGEKKFQGSGFRVERVRGKQAEKNMEM